LSPGLKAQSYQESEKRHLKASSTQSLLLDEETIMIVENCGESGYEKTALSGSNWIRYDKIVGFFHEAEVAQQCGINTRRSKAQEMGTYETRPCSEFRVVKSQVH
jgi:hypothetical protein